MTRKTPPQAVTPTPRSSRRGFLAAASALGATALGSPMVLLGASASSMAANDRLRIALLGCGNQGCRDMGNLLSCGVRLAALCDPDPQQVRRARRIALRRGGEETKNAKSCSNYRKLLDNTASFDAVVIGTPDHWHAPLCKAFIAAGKHVYCEKPLTHSVAEARELRELVRGSKVVTQLGNQGSASASMRRCTELVRAGALGQVREIHHWGIGVAASEGNAPGIDPIPKGFDWDLWVGPSAMRPFNKVYHPQTWRHWWDFGNGGLADFWCHAFNMPMRALELGYPDHLVVNLRDGNKVPGKPAVEFHFPARGSLAPLVFYWHGEGRPATAIVQPLLDVGRDANGGLMVIGEKGCIYTDHWNMGGLIRIAGEPQLKDVLHHPATQDIPQSLPRVKGHEQEFVDACHGNGKTFSDFDIGGKMTEIGLAGSLAVRARNDLDWDGEKMLARNAPETARFVHPVYRRKWL